MFGVKFIGRVQNPADVLIRQALQPDIDVVLVFQPVLKHFKLQNADHADDDLLHAGAEIAEDLDRAFLRDLLHPLDKLLALHCIDLGHPGEMLGREGRDAGKPHLVLLVAQRIPDREDARVEQADDVAGVGLGHNRAVVGHQARAGRKLDVFALLHMERLHAALKLARADSQKRDAVAVVLVHVGLDFEDKAGKILARRRHGLSGVGVGAGQRRRGQPQELFQERLNAKVGQRRPEEHRRELAAVDGRKVKFLGCAVKQLNVLSQFCVVVGPDQSVERRVAELGCNLVHHLDAVRAAVALKREYAAGVTVKHALEPFAAADRPVHRVGLDAEDFLNVLHQFKRVAGFAVHFIDKGKDRDMPQRADLEQLDRLRLNALGRVDDHDGRVGRHQGAVGIFGEVLVARGIEDIDALALVMELQHRRSDRDTALFFNVHPVRHGMLGALLAFDRACGLDRTPVKKQFFG